MAKQDSLDRVWDVIERVGVCMFTTRSATGMRARPLEARPDRNNGIIWFVTDLRSAKEHEIVRDPAVGLVFVDADAKAYLSITAEAAIRRDHAKVAEVEAHRQCVVARTRRRQCLRAARHAFDCGAMGRPVQQSRRGFRIPQGAGQGRAAQSR